MSEVYRATDNRLDRTIAVKVPPGHVANNQDLRQRFEREAKTFAALSHPHICSVFDAGNQDGNEFLVMEYLEGHTLQECIQKSALPFDQALQVAIQKVDALAAARRAGVIRSIYSSYDCNRAKKKKGATSIARMVMQPRLTTRAHV